MQLKTFKILAIGIAVGLFVPGTAAAADILCKDSAKNHMLIDDVYVSACLDAGVGNIQGDNATKDAFLTGVGEAYEFIDKSEKAGTLFTQSNGTGTFFFGSSLWSSYSQIAIGFKFGTGNRADDWFVYSLQPNVSSGTWKFVNTFGRGGGASHVNLYGIQRVTVPEPATLGLLAMGVLGFGFRRRNGVAQA